MSHNGKVGQSLNTLLGAIIVAVVFTVLGLHATYNYRSQRQQMIDELQHSAALSIVTLQQNITPLIEAYAVNEYDKLLATEVDLRHHFAIVVTDLNMGKVRAEVAYTSGKIRDAAGKVINFNPKDPVHQQQLLASFYTKTAPIVATSGTQLGSIAIYSSDNEILQALNRLLVASLVDTLFIALLLIAMLVFAIRRLLVRPLAQIAEVIGRSDVDGIPTSAIPSFALREISILTDSMNTMIQLIGRSRDLLQQRSATLAGANAELARLGEAMAHHFQEPTRRLSSFAQRLLAKSDLASDEDSRLSLHFIDAESKRLSNLVRDAQCYLALDHRQISVGEVADSAAALRQCIEAAGSAAAEVNIVLHEPLPRVRLAQKTLGELFAILLDNALRYRDPQRALRIEVRANTEDKRAVFRFADNGSGIAREYRVQALGLFTRLVPSSIPGTGMGLALANKIVILANGRLYIEDGLEGGVCIVFDLPLEIVL